jgi:hypothetical protein
MFDLISAILVDPMNLRRVPQQLFVEVVSPYVPLLVQPQILANLQTLLADMDHDCWSVAASNSNDNSTQHLDWDSFQPSLMDLLAINRMWKMFIEWMQYFPMSRHRIDIFPGAITSSRPHTFLGFHLAILSQRTDVISALSDIISMSLRQSDDEIQNVSNRSWIVSMITSRRFVTVAVPRKQNKTSKRHFGNHFRIEHVLTSTSCCCGSSSISAGLHS